MNTKKYPFVKQNDLKDCGVASLQMIIMYYKGYISLEDLRNLTKTTKLGTNAYNLIEGAKSLGFDAKGIKAHLSDLNENNLILPCIAHVTIDEKYMHYIVIYEINFNKNFLIIADPSSKIKKISFEEFSKIYNNILLILYPTTTLPVNKKSSIKQFYLTIYQKHLIEFIKIGILSIILTILSIILSYSFKYFIDNYSNIYILNFLLHTFLILGILKGITTFVRNKILIILNTKIDFAIMLDTFRKIINLPFSYYRNRTTGEVIARLNDLNNVKELLSKLIVTIFVDIPLAIISGCILFSINHTLFYYLLIILITHLVIILLSNKIIEKKILLQKQKEASVSSFMVESITGINTIKGLNIEENISRKFEKKYYQLLNNHLAVSSLINFQILSKDLLDILCQIITLYLGVKYIHQNLLSIGKLITYITLLNYFLDPIKNIITLSQNTKEAKISLKRVLEMLEITKEKGIIKTKPTGDIRIQNLNYSFDNNQKILKNINLKIKKGEKILLTGKSGSGKSTLLNLLAKNYEANRNTIFLNNIDINDYQNYKENIAYISQQEILYTDTIYNNINIIKNDKFLEIAKMCYVDEIVKNNNIGYNMVIEENGFNISGGQKQRIVLARALMKDTDFLFIDEGLSQIDVNMERKILKNLFTLKDKTIIIVSHRLKNIDLYDRVINLEQIAKGN